MHRRLISLLALACCVVYATWVPWLGAIMAAERALALELTGQEICIGSGRTADATDARSTGEQQPARSGADCPICKAVGAFQLVILAAAELGLLEPAAYHYAAPADERPSASPQVVPRSRGPPTLA